MRRGIPSGADQIRGEKSDIDKHTLGNLDLLNLRLTPPSRESKKSSSEQGAGDNLEELKITQRNQLLAKLGLTGPNCHTVQSGNDKSKILSTVPAQTLLTKPVDDFLLPPNRQHSREIYRSKSTYRLSSAGDAGNFPFESTSSGNLKVKTQQVVYESKKLSVLVADPKNTKINIYSEQPSEPNTMKKYNYSDFPKNSAMDAILTQAGIAGLGSIIGDTPARKAAPSHPEYEAKDTSQILDPELNLGRLGYSGAETVDWTKVTLPEKKDLYLELCKRITNRKNADCKVIIGKDEFSCHLIVLQCYSELFDGYVAIKKVEIPSERCTPTAFHFIYEWMISEDKKFNYLTRDNVLDIFNSAKYLKIKDLVEQCWAFVDNIEVFHEDTAFLLYKDAKVKNVEEVRELMIPRIQDFFLILVSSQDWLELTVEDVKNLLSSNYIRINCEMEVFMASVRWLKYDWVNRDRYKYEVLSYVRFGNIAPWQLVDIKRNPENPEFLELARDPTICKLIDDGLAFVIIKYWYGHENDDFQHWNTVLGLNTPQTRNWSGLDRSYFTYREFLIYLDQYRRNQLIEKAKNKGPLDDLGEPSGIALPHEDSQRDSFLTQKKGHAVSDKGISTNQSSINKLSEEGERISLLKLFTPSKNALATRNLNRLSSSLISTRENNFALDSSLFLLERETILIFGGIDPFTPYGTGKNTGRNIYRYLPDINTWEYIGDLPEPRHHHSVGFLKGRIYLVGGTDPRDDEIRGKSFVVNTVWSFDAVRRRWFSEPNLREHRRSFGLVTSQQKMYVIGGCNRKLISLYSVERYDPRSAVWKAMAPMKHARAGVACAKYRDYIWAVGGTTDVKCNHILDIVECYDVKTNQWTTIPRLNQPKSFSCLFAMSDRLYLIGGTGYKRKKDQYTCSLGEMEKWNISKLLWERVADLAIPRHSHAIAYIGTQIFILGGITTIYMKSLGNTECYCTKRDAWVRGIACLPIALSGHAAITLPPAMLMSNKS